MLSVNAQVDWYDMPLPPPNMFSQSPLDRLDSRRRDLDWIEAQRRDSRTLCVVVWRSRALVRRSAEDVIEPVYMPMDAVAVDFAAAPWALLGSREGQTLFALDLSAWDEPLPALTLSTGAATFEDLRRMGGLLPAADAAILAHARGLMHWRTRHRFCATCGAACAPHDAGHVMHCNGCGAHHFPRTDPAVIMLVTHGERALLGQPARFRDMRVMTTLAGFVEPGETLEEAVAREVMEEAGVRVTDVRYHSSQPWPFPASIMLGFSATATTQEIHIDADELVDARWFSREELVDPQGFVLPPRISIARRLIDDWIERKEGLLF